MSDSLPTGYYEGLDDRLRALDGLVCQLVADLVGWYREYLDVGEYGLAVEIVAERLTPEMPRELVESLAAGLLPEAETMRLAPGVIERLRRLIVDDQ
jgi:hypothetical protein